MTDEEFPDYYSLLRVSPDATSEEVRRAYLEEVLFYHPDNFRGRAERIVRRAHEMTVRLNEAKEILLDPEKRAGYDELYVEWKRLELERGSPSSAGAGSDLVGFLEAQGLEIIDKRPRGGALWVVGGKDKSDLMAELRGRGFNFAFASRGSYSTLHRPAWYLRPGA